eukprot:gene34604-19778_t
MDAPFATSGAVDASPPTAAPPPPHVAPMPLPEPPQCPPAHDPHPPCPAALRAALRAAERRLT